MKKFISLLKATTKGDLNVFKVKGDSKSTIKRYGLLAFLSLIMMFSAFTYADLIAEPLHKMNMTFILLTLFSLAIVMLNIMEGIYKSQGILFDAKDNNLVFSLPIEKKYILSTRLIKLIAFDYIFQFLFFVPCVIRYATFEHPGFNFYLITLLFFILLPLIPTIIACVIGYITKAFSSKFRHKKLVQTLTSLILFFVLYFIMFNMKNVVTGLAAHAKSINDLISKVYLPIGLYIDLISKFDIVKLLELILISVVPFILFIYIFQIKYDKVINSSKESSSVTKKHKGTVKSKSIIKALTIKELMTYFSLPVYIFNTIIGPLLAVIAAVGVVFKFDDIMASYETAGLPFSIDQVMSHLPYAVIVIILALTCMTSITSSSISLEGKKLPLLKSLPINPYDIYKAKIYCSDIIIIPFMLLSAIIMCIRLKICNYFLIFIFLTCTVLPHLIGEIGLLVNLKYPKFDYNSETEVIKQSFAVLISILIGMILAVIPIFSFPYIAGIIGELPTLIIAYTILIIVTIILNNVIKNYGAKRYLDL